MLEPSSAASSEAPRTVFLPEEFRRRNNVESEWLALREQFSRTAQRMDVSHRTLFGPRPLREGLRTHLSTQTEASTECNEEWQGELETLDRASTAASEPRTVFSQVRRATRLHASALHLLPNLASQIDDMAEDSDRDDNDPEDNFDLCTVLEAIRSMPTNTASSDVLMQVASVTTPTSWAIVKLDLDKSLPATMKLHMQRGALLKMRNDQLISLDEYQRFYLGFFAQAISRLFDSIASYPCFLNTSYSKVGEMLHNEKFWLQQLLLAAANPDDAQPPPYLLVRLLGYRKSLDKHAALPNSLKMAAGHFWPVSAIVVFLPVQLALWITAHLRGHVDTLSPLTATANHPNLFLDSLPFQLPESDERRTKGSSSSKGQSKGTKSGSAQPGTAKGSKKGSAQPGSAKGSKSGSAQPGTANQEKEGRIFRAHLRVSPPLAWPALPQWPHALSPEERRQFQSFTNRLLSSSNASTTQERIDSVFRVKPAPVSLALTIYEPDPLQATHSKEGIDFSNHFVVQHYLSGPKRLRRTLAHSQVQTRLEEPLNNLDSSFLFKKTFDEALTLHLDKVFGPGSQQGSELRRRSEQRSRSRKQNISKPRSPEPSSSSNATHQWQERSSRSRTSDTSRQRDDWQASSSNDTWEDDSWTQSKWQPKDWSQHSWERR